MEWLYYVIAAVVAASIAVFDFWLGYWVSNRRIKKDRQLAVLKERFFDFYLPAYRRLYGYVNIGLGPVDEKYADRFIRSLYKKSYLASEQTRTNIFICARMNSEALADEENAKKYEAAFYDIVNDVERTCLLLASELGYGIAPL